MSIDFRIVAGSMMVIFALSACSSKETNNQAEATKTAKPSNTKEPAALIVNGTAISQHEVDMLLHQQPSQRDAPAARRQVLDNITLQVLVAQEALKKGLDKSPDMIDELDMAKTTVLAQSYVKDYFKHQQIDDAQLTAAYDKLKTDANSKQYRARHILVKTREEGDAIIVKLKRDPKSFGELAGAQSLDPVTKAKGGDLGWFNTKGMVPEFGAAITGLKKGEFTQTPVKSQFGYHVIVLDDVRSNADTVPPFDQVKASLADQVRQQSLKKMLEDLKSQAKIETVVLAKAP